MAHYMLPVSKQGDDLCVYGINLLSQVGKSLIDSGTLNIIFLPGKAFFAFYGRYFGFGFFFSPL